MLTKLTKLISLSAVAILLSAGAVLAQVENVSVSITFPPPAVDKIKLADLAKFDPAASGGSSRILFSLTIENTENSLTLIPKDKLSLTFAFNGAKIVRFTNGNPVRLTASEKVTLNNLNALKSDSRFNFKLDGGLNIDEVVKALYGSGASFKSIDAGAPLPAGEYSFVLEVIGGKAPASASIQLSNPTGYVELIGPGSVFGAGEPMVIMDRQPVITWIGDAPGFVVKVVEKGQNDKSVGDLLSKTPNFETTTKARFVRYPASGVTPLVSGKTYVVLLASQVNTMSSNKPEEQYATPLEFKIQESQSAAEAASDQFIERLKMLVGEQYNAEFEKLKGGKVSGDPSINGATISTQDFMQLGQKIQIGQATVKAVRVN